MRISLIIAAGGSGSRFKAGLRGKAISKVSQPASKLFYSLAGKPLLLRTLLAFQSVSEIKETVLALPAGVDKLIDGWVRQYSLQGIRRVRGGATRSESVQFAMKACSPKQDWVMIHDGARPLIQPKQIRDLARQAKIKKWDACLLAKRVVPTIKQISNRGRRVEKTLNRDVLCEAETPQLFKRKALTAAYRAQKNIKDSVTDEASLLESHGIPVHLLLHEEWNPKITSVMDFKLAENAISGSGEMHSRMGLGSDTHRLVEGRPFKLGGVRLDWNYGPLGHSDGDALLHAIIDALLGAAALGDIGDLFSDTDPRHKNRDSREMVAMALNLLKKHGWRPAQLDCTIHLERPKLGKAKKQMVKTIADLLGLEESWISIKAKTFEGDGTGGAGLLVRCEVLAVIQRS